MGEGVGSPGKRSRGPTTAPFLGFTLKDSDCCARCFVALGAFHFQEPCQFLPLPILKLSTASLSCYNLLWEAGSFEDYVTLRLSDFL